MAKKILIGLILPRDFDENQSPSYQSYLKLKPIDGYTYDLSIKKGIYIADNRNDTISGDYDYYMPLDGDHTFTTENIKQLLAHDKDIIFGIYESRQKPDFATATEMITESAGYNIPMSSTGLKKALMSGLGFGLIKRCVIDKIEKPTFHNPRYQGKCLGEDVAFCMDAINAGFDVWIDCNCKIGHILDMKIKETCKMISIELTEQQHQNLKVILDSGKWEVGCREAAAMVEVRAIVERAKKTEEAKKAE